MMKKKVLALVLALTMVLSLLPVTAMAATLPDGADAGNGMAYLYNVDGFSLWGLYGGDWKSTSYNDLSYKSYLVEGDYTAKTDAVAFASDPTNGLVCETANLKGKIEVIPVAGQQLLKISYTIENTGNSTADYVIGSGVDIKIGDNDNAEVRPIKDSSNAHIGFKMLEKSLGAQFSFFKNDADSFWYGSVEEDAGYKISETDPWVWYSVEEFAEDKGFGSGFGWSGYYSEDDEIDAVFKSATEHSFGIEDLVAKYSTAANANALIFDSAASWRWDGSLAAGESVTHSIYIGIGAEGDESDFNFPTYDVTFDTNGATGTVPTQTAAAAGGTFTLPDASGLTKDGYAFAGWSDGSNNYQAGATFTMPANAVTFTAQWEVIPTYTVTFDANGHGTAPAAITGVTSGSTITAPTAPTADGYTFGGWYTDANCTAAFDFTTAITGNITLYAKWTQNAPAPQPPVYYPTYTPTPEVEKVETPKTADAGIFLAVSMSILSVTGSAVLLKKKED